MGRRSPATTPNAARPPRTRRCAATRIAPAPLCLVPQASPLASNATTTTEPSPKPRCSTPACRAGVISAEQRAACRSQAAGSQLAPAEWEGLMPAKSIVMAFVLSGWLIGLVVACFIVAYTSFFRLALLGLLVW